MSNPLQALLPLKIPGPLRRRPGFLEITGQATKEETISKTYQYFLNRHHSPMADMFLESLNQLIEQKLLEEKREVPTLPQPRSNYHCYTEVQVMDRKRIDLLIRDYDHQAAIIIENKVRAAESNPLQKYWDSVQVPDTHKAGVLLTLQPENTRKGFVNITHLEWLDQVKGRLQASSSIPANDPSIQYFEDLYSTLEQHTQRKQPIMNDQIDFFFQHAEKINAANQTLLEARAYVKAQFEKAAVQLGYTCAWNTGDDVCYLYPSSRKDIFYCFWIPPLYATPQRLHFWIEIKQGIKKQKNHMVQEVQELVNETDGVMVETHHQIRLVQNDDQHPKYVFNLSEAFQTEQKELHQFIVERIREDFIPIFDQAIKSLTT